MHRHVGHISNKAAGGQNIPREGLGKPPVALLDASTGPADQVDVVGVVGQVIARRAVVEVGVSHDCERLQRLEGPVDGRGCERGSAIGRDPGDDLVGGGMAQCCHGIEHPLALVCHPAPLGPQLVAVVLHGHHCTVAEPTDRHDLPRHATYTGRVLDQFEDTETPPARPRRSRLKRMSAIILALVLLVVVGGSAAYLLFLNHTVDSNVKHESLLPTPGVGGASDAPTKNAAAKDAQNFLIIGSDARSGLAGARSDVIVLMHVAGDRKTVNLIHFPRDLYVDIPGRGKDKINAAFAYGGAPLLVQTIQGLVGVPVDHVAIIDFEGFKRMTDAVGGVNVYVEESSASSSYTFTKGYQQMGGAEALAFVRERKDLSEGDISRGRRQQAFIKALMLKSLSKSVLANPVKLAEFVDAGTSNLTVDQDFSTGDMRSEAVAMRNLRGKDIAFITAPFTGYGTSPVGGSIDLLDVPGMATLGEALQNDAMETYEDVTRTP